MPSGMSLTIPFRVTSARPASTRWKPTSSVPVKAGKCGMPTLERGIPMLIGCLASAPEWTTGIKVGTFSRDISTATGDVSYTGVGFKPSVLILVGGNPAGGTDITVIGFSDGTTHYGLDHVTGTWYFDGPTVILVRKSGSDYNTIAVKTMDADGFTLTYTKAGSPTGTVTFGYLALR